MIVACLATKGFEDSELSLPRKALLQAGHEVVIVAPHKDPISGYHGRLTFDPDKSIDEVNAEEFDALFIPGGYSPDQLRADERFVAFVRSFGASDRPIFAICHGPQLLFTAGVLDGRSCTAWKTIQYDLRRAGIDVYDKPVIIHDNLITSRQPSDIPEFTEAILSLLKSKGREEARLPSQGVGETSATLH